MPYKLPEHLHNLYFQNWLFNRVCQNAWAERASYTRMLELAVEVLAQHAGDCERREHKALLQLGTPIGVHDWVVEGSPGMYSTNYRCRRCGDVHRESVDNPKSAKPALGCGLHPRVDPQAEAVQTVQPDTRKGQTDDSIS